MPPSRRVASSTHVSWVSNVKRGALLNAFRSIFLLLVWLGNGGLVNVLEARDVNIPGYTVIFNIIQVAKIDADLS